MMNDRRVDQLQEAWRRAKSLWLSELAKLDKQGTGA